MITLENLPSIDVHRKNGWTLVYAGTTEGTPCTVVIGDYSGIRSWYGNNPIKDDNGSYLKAGDILDVTENEILYLKTIKSEKVTVSVVKRNPA